MTKKPDSLTRRLTIVNELGMHARSAAMIAKMAQDAVSDVWVACGGERVDATSVIDLLTLGCAKGTEVIVSVENPDDEKVLDMIADLVTDGFGE
jgi:phosphotransferase system HPr (HPr) family protein